MTIQLSPEQEKIVAQALRKGMIAPTADLVTLGVEALQARLDVANESGDEGPVDSWLSEFEAWVEGHPHKAPLLPNEALDRESIYGRRGQ